MSTILLLAPLFFAQPATRPAEPDPAQRVTRYDFPDEEVGGTADRPAGERVDGHLPVRMPSLVRLRESFTPELLQAAETL